MLWLALPVGGALPHSLYPVAPPAQSPARMELGSGGPGLRWVISPWQGFKRRTVPPDVPDAIGARCQKKAEFAT